VICHCSPAEGTVAAFEFAERRHVPLAALGQGYTKNWTAGNRQMRREAAIANWCESRLGLPLKKYAFAVFE
jgi:hypothetical protein